jgi:(2Fe-2S) ferredoxin
LHGTRYRLSVCKGPDCRRNGSDGVYAKAQDTLAKCKLTDTCEAYRGGCYGLCHLGPNVVVRVDTGRPRDFLSREDFQLMGWPGEVHYSAMTPEKMQLVVEQHIGQGKPVESLQASSANAPPAPQPAAAKL